MPHPPEGLNTPWIVAHRGGLRDAPENTRAAFDAALDHPVDGIELDVQMTRDGVLVLHHDGNLLKVNGGARRIADLTYAELSDRDWGGWYDASYAAERILTLEEALRRYIGRTRIMVEIKSFLRDRRHGRSYHIAVKVLDILEREVPASRADHVFVLSFDPEVLRHPRREATHRRFVLNTLNPKSVMNTSVSRPNGLYAYCTPVAKLSAEFVDYAHGAGKRVMTYACNTPRQVDKARCAGVDVIMTDRPAWIFQYLNSRESRK